MKRSEHLKNVLIYCRESRDDGFVNYERIETQRDILVAYCKNKNLGNIIDIIMDDNKSGTDFERLDPIKERIRNNEVDILLLKDASRLGRNILESLTFTAFLDKHNVELVFESERYDEDMFPLIAWFNERRAKDDSIKIRRVLKHKMEEGEIVIKAPYGYIKCGNKLVVDEETAPVVREIFDLFLNGYGKYEIATIINHRGYSTPSQLKSHHYKGSNCAPAWNKQHIERILNHVIYTGDMPYGMRKKVSFKSKKYEIVDRDDWIIVPDHHAPIISKEDFAAAQSRMRRNKRTKARNPSVNLFSGLLYCGRCGSRLYRKTEVGKSPWYSCRKSDQEGTVKDHIRPNYGCYSHRVRETVLIEIVKDYIGQLISTPEHREDIRMAIIKKESSEAKTRQEIQSAKNRIEALKKKASKVYDDKLDGRLPDYLFNGKLGEITKEISGLSAALEELEQTLTDIRDTESLTDRFSCLVRQVQEMGVNNQSLSLLFKKIIVFNQFDIKPEDRDRYSIAPEEYDYLFENGGLLFIQNFIFKATVYREKPA